MNILNIIEKKKNKEELSNEEIKYVVDGFVSDKIKDYQMSSLLMAIVINGMTDEETFSLTDAMLNSGDVMNLKRINGVKIDKHSTGGVGDKTSFVALPLAASAGVKIAKMSGRGLGFTGGTIDKLESISGFKTSIGENNFFSQVNNIGIALVSQSNDLVPADKKIYALRDVSGTTESIPLIASSIMSKKLASGSDKIILDVKVGKGAFMKKLEDAKKLAELMVKIGKNAGKETIAFLTNMDYPLGRTIGNGLEVEEAIKTLKGEGDTTFLDLCIEEASYMVKLAKGISIEEAKKIVKSNYENGLGYKKFEELIMAQDGNINDICVESNKVEIFAQESGYISDIDTLKLAELVSSLGAGRKTKDDIINHGVGLILNKTYGEEVKKGDILAFVCTKDNINISDYEKSFIINKIRPNKLKMIYEIIK